MSPHALRLRRQALQVPDPIETPIWYTQSSVSPPIASGRIEVSPFVSPPSAGDKDVDDEEMLERAQLCGAAFRAIIAAIGDVFERTIAPMSANDRTARREIRAAVGRLTHIDDEAKTFAKALGARTRQHSVGGEGARTPGQAVAARGSCRP